jgi:hypothetical protein
MMKHRKFDVDTVDYDYAILELMEPMDFVNYPHVSPICWPSARPKAEMQVSAACPQYCCNLAWVTSESGNKNAGEMNFDADT